MGLNITSIESNLNFFAINSDSILIITNGDSIFETQNYFSNFKPASFQFNNNSYLIGVHVGNPAQQFPSRVNIFSYDGVSFDINNANLTSIITTPPVVREIAGSYQILLGTSDGRIMIYNFESLLSGNPFPAEITIESDAEVTQISYMGTRNYAIASKIANNAKYDLVYSEGIVLQFPDENLLKLVSTNDYQGGNISIVSSSMADKYYFRLIQNDKVIKTIDAPSLQSVTQFSIADIKNDGNNYLLTNSAEIKFLL